MPKENIDKEIESLRKAIEHLSATLGLANLADMNLPHSNDEYHMVFSRMRKYVDLLEGELIHF